MRFLLLGSILFLLPLLGCNKVTIDIAGNKLSKEISLVRTDNFGGARGGDSQDVGVTIVENKQTGPHPLEVSVTIGDQVTWNGFSIPLPTVSDSYRVTYNNNFEPMAVTPQIWGGRAHVFRSAIDSQGSRYISSYVKGTVSFANTSVAFTPVGTNQGLFIKEGANGDLKWYYSIHGGLSGLSNFALDKNDNVYILGNFGGGTSLYFNGISMMNLDNTYNYFLMKLSPDGTLNWIRYFKTGQIREIEVYETNILLAGYFSNTMLIEDKQTLTSVGNTDAVIALYDTNGNFLWSKQAGGALADVFACGTLDQDGIFVSGFFSDNPTIDSSTINSSDRTATLVKLNYTGNLVWQRSLGVTATASSVQSNCVSTFGNNVYWGTYSEGTVQIENGPTMNLTGNRAYLFQVSKDNGTTKFFDSLSGFTTASVFETFVDKQGRLVYGVFWMGTEILFRDESIALNAGGFDAFLGIFTIPQ